MHMVDGRRVQRGIRERCGRREASATAFSNGRGCFTVAHVVKGGEALGSANPPQTGNT